MSNVDVSAVLFDKDGTLIDLHTAWVGAGVTVLEELCRRAGADDQRDPLLREGGYDPEQGRLTPDSPWAAGTTQSLVEHWLARLELDASMVPEMLERMTAEATAGARPIADLDGLFERLRGRGLRLGVATMDLAASAEATLTRFGLRAQVDFVCGCDSGHGLKPGPGMVHAFCEAMGLEPERVAVVGDTPHDMHMGRSAGAAAVVGVLSGAASRSALAPLADHLLEDVSTLESLLAR